jgi:hypothetical protein
VAVNVTEPHAVEGFADEETVVTVGEPTANAGSAEDTTPRRGTITASTATIAIRRFMFIPASGHDSGRSGEKQPGYR